MTTDPIPAPAPPLSPCCGAGILNYYSLSIKGQVVAAKYRCRECKADVPDPNQPTA